MLIVEFELSEAEYDALLRQMSKRIHDLRDKLQGMTFTCPAPEVLAQTKTDLATMETLRLKMQTGAFTKQRYEASQAALGESSDIHRKLNDSGIHGTMDTVRERDN